jgi:membrane AbrB-like protein
MQWLALLAVSVILVALLELAGLPAALFLGPMVAAIVLAAAETQVKLPGVLFTLAQAVIGCMIARSIPATIPGDLLADWPIYLAGIVAVVVVAAGLGVLLARLKVLPGTTAIWGSAPGASTAMMLMAEGFGADIRLVAFMLYLRVVLVAVVASVVARVFGGGGAAPAVSWFPEVAWVPLAETLALALGGFAVSRLLPKLPAGALLVPFIVGIVLQNSFGMQIELPPSLLAVSYAIIGWTIGLRFTRPILAHAARAFPKILLSTLVLIAVCGLFAWMLVWLAGVDPLTAYLATSPGGADSIAIIAVNAKVDVPLVMAMQTGRFIVVMLTGPALARFIARRLKTD